MKHTKMSLSLHRPSFTQSGIRGTIVGVGLRLQTRRDVLAQMVPHYRNAASAQNKQMLHEFTQIIGYHRKYAM